MIQRAKKPPLHPDDSRDFLRRNGVTQSELAKDYGASETAICMFLSGRAYSQPFWDFFFEKYPAARSYAKAS